MAPVGGGNASLATLAVRLEAVGQDRLARQLREVQGRLIAADKAGAGLTESTKMASESAVQSARRLAQLTRAQARTATSSRRLSVEQSRVTQATKEHTRALADQSVKAQVAGTSLRGFRRVLQGNVYTASVVGRAINALSSPIQAATAAFAFLASAIAISLVQIAQFEKQLRPLQARSRLTNETLQTLGSTVQALGLDRGGGGGGGRGGGLQQGFDAAAEASQELRTRLGELEQFGTGPAGVAIDALGLSLENLLALSQDDRLNTIIRALQSIPTISLQQHLAEELLGDTGAEGLASVLNSSAVELMLWQQTIVNSRANLTSDQLIIARKQNDAGEELRLALTGIRNQIGTLLSPLVTSLLENLTVLISGLQDVIDVLNDRESILRKSLDLLTGGFRVDPSDFPGQIDFPDIFRLLIGTQDNYLRQQEIASGRIEARQGDPRGEALASRNAERIRSNVEGIALEEEQTGELELLLARRRMRLADLQSNFDLQSTRAHENFLFNRLRIIRNFNRGEARIVSNALLQKLRSERNYNRTVERLREDAALRIRRAEEKLGEDVLEVQRESYDRRAQLFVDYRRRLDDLTRRTSRRVEDAESQFGHSFAQRNLAVARIELDARRSREDEEIRHNRRLQDLGEDAGESRASAEENATDQIARIEEDLAIRLARLAEDRALQLSDIDESAKRAAALRLENHNRGLADSEESFDRASAQRQDNFEISRLTLIQTSQRAEFALRIEHHREIEAQEREHSSNMLEIRADFLQRYGAGATGQIDAGLSGSPIPRIYSTPTDNFGIPRRNPLEGLNLLPSARLDTRRTHMDFIQDMVTGGNSANQGSGAINNIEINIAGDVLDAADFNNKVYDALDRGGALGVLK